LGSFTLPLRIQKISKEKNMINMQELEKSSLSELRKIAEDLNVPNSRRLKRENLIVRISEHQSEEGENGEKILGGVLEIMPEGIGFLRQNYKLGKDDVYVSQAQIRRYNLRSGDLVIGESRPPRENERHYGITKVNYINGHEPSDVDTRPNFDFLTPVFPDQRFDLETSPSVLSTRLINLIAPIGRGQRAMIVSPPKAGKTTILKEITNAIATNHPETYNMMLLIGERPEEVTDRSVTAEVISSTFDEPVASHVRTAEIALQRAKRLVELGKDVVIVMDSLTRLARAYNLVVSPSGRTLSGGMDPSALYPPKRFYGAARNIEEGGSLTIIATALVDTGSRLDDVVFEEFKGTGNMELHLSRRLQERRIFPSIDIERSSTRREDLLLSPEMLQRVWLMRRMYIQMTSSPPQGANMDAAVASEAILQRLSKSKNNVEFLESLTEDS
jgi:transcription termination factor Rho